MKKSVCLLMILVIMISIVLSINVSAKTIELVNDDPVETVSETCNDDIATDEIVVDEEVTSVEEIETEELLLSEASNVPVVHLNDLKVGNNTISVSWNKVSGASKYRLSYKRSTWNYWKDLTDTKSLSYTDKNFTNNIHYYYRVLPLDSKGNVLNGNYSAKGVVYHTTPTNLKASAVTEQGKIKITWNSVEGCKKYQVFFKRLDRDTSWRKLKTSNTNSYIDINCANDKNYMYTVRCIDDSGNFQSGYESGVKIHYYRIPENLKAVRYDSYGRIRITWDKVGGVSKYQVFYKRAGWTSWKKCKGLASGTSYIDTGCSNGVTYFYTVRACDSNGKFISSYDPDGVRITYYRQSMMYAPYFYTLGGRLITIEMPLNWQPKITKSSTGEDITFCVTETNGRDYTVCILRCMTATEFERVKNWYISQGSSLEKSAEYYGKKGDYYYAMVWLDGYGYSPSTQFIIDDALKISHDVAKSFRFCD